jgi:hypothetical protein
VSPSSSLSSSSSQRLFAAFLVLLAVGLSGSDGVVGACGCGGTNAGTCGAEMGGAVTNCAAIGVTLLVILLCRQRLFAGAKAERLQCTDPYWRPVEWLIEK